MLMLNYKDSNTISIKELLRRYGMKIHCLDQDQDIMHSFWGAPEAGRLKDRLFIRTDTPVHSILHESCHYICMSPKQRSASNSDAKGTAMEENATCYLQILLADHIEGYDRQQEMNDMDAWGYSFRLGSAQAWFEQDAEDAQEWLIYENIINQDNQPSWKLRI